MFVGFTDHHPCPTALRIHWIAEGGGAGGGGGGNAATHPEIGALPRSMNLLNADALDSLKPNGRLLRSASSYG